MAAAGPRPAGERNGVTIDSIGPKPPKLDGPGAVQEAGPAGKSGGVEKPTFKQELGALSSPEKIADRLTAAIQDAASQIGAGTMTKDQAIDLIIERFREELTAVSMKPDEVEDAVAFVRETIADDPLVDSLLKKP
jgi:hypothetical protein